MNDAKMESRVAEAARRIGRVADEAPNLFATCAACEMIAEELATMDLPAGALQLVHNQLNILGRAFARVAGEAP